MPDEYLTTTEAAKICNVTRFTVLNWIKQGKLPASSTLGGHQRVCKRTLLELCCKAGHAAHMHSVTVKPLPKKINRSAGQRAPKEHPIKTDNSDNMAMDLVRKGIYESGRQIAFLKKGLSKVFDKKLAT
ncbi:MAG: helix-turn-helix domain-containing protein [Candidatus Omnitrophica bacterium]|nr:helix-turn-helix domain-containing protein [Candidatus Omnitrophota bacterium]